MYIIFRDIGCVGFTSAMVGWLGLGAGFGNAQVYNQPESIGESLSSPPSMLIIKSG